MGYIVAFSALLSVAGIIWWLNRLPLKKTPDQDTFIQNW